MAQTDELSARIGEILSSPEQMRQIQSLASMLGLGNDPQPAQPPEPEPGLDPAMLSTITGAISKMGSMGKDDPSVTLLLALRPLLGETRQHRVDEAAKLLKLAKMLPLLRESGLLNLEL